MATQPKKMNIIKQVLTGHKNGDRWRFLTGRGKQITMAPHMANSYQEQTALFRFWN